jgi:hypothetical protein
VHRQLRAALATGAVVGLSLRSAAADINVASRGEVAVETRAFLPDDTAKTYTSNLAVASRLEANVEVPLSGGSKLSARLRGFVRFDRDDRERSVMFPEELYASAEFEPLRVRVGYQMLNWTATEAFHPADVINSRVLDGSFENPEKIGELMVSARVKFPHGNLETFLLPRFAEPVLASANSPLNLAPPGVQLGNALVLDAGRELTDKYWQPQWAVRAQATLADVDVSAHLVHHIDRLQPLVAVDLTTFQPLPVYQAVTQAGGTLSWVISQTIVKLEGAYRAFAHPVRGYPSLPLIPRRDHVLATVGLEHVTGVFGDGAETSLLTEVEWLFPTQDELPEPLEPLFQHDALVGVRHSFNDQQSTTILATAIVDLKRPDQVLGNLQLNRRLGDEWNVMAGLRLFFFPPRDPLAPVLFENLNKQHHLYLNLTRFF